MNGFDSWKKINSITLEPIRKKLVIVGDDACGKTCLLSVFLNDQFPEIKVPKDVVGKTVDFELNERKVILCLSFKQIYSILSSSFKFFSKLQLELWDTSN